jgi:hypothetical protein
VGKNADGVEAEEERTFNFRTDSPSSISNLIPRIIFAEQAKSARD